MREVYKKYFKVSDNEKISDRVMFTRIGVSAVLIVAAVLAVKKMKKRNAAEQK